MKSCGRRLKSTRNRCGVLFEGSGAYCRDCRNEYQKEYYARRKEPLYKPSTEKTGGSCQACATALRSNTVAIVDMEGLEQTVVLCETCKAIVTYLSETVDESAAEFLIDLATEIAELKATTNTTPTTSHTSHTSHTSSPSSRAASVDGVNKADNVDKADNVEVCLNCEVRPARSHSVFCEQCGA